MGLMNANPDGFGELNPDMYDMMKRPGTAPSKRPLR